MSNSTHRSVCRCRRCCALFRQASRTTADPIKPAPPVTKIVDRLEKHLAAALKMFHCRGQIWPRVDCSSNFCAKRGGYDIQDRMQAIKTDIPEVLVFEPVIHADRRGRFAEVFSGQTIRILWAAAILRSGQFVSLRARRRARAPLAESAMPGAACYGPAWIRTGCCCRCAARESDVRPAR